MKETPKESMFTPLPSKRAFEEISDQIRQLIFSKVLKPGDKLPSERELAIQFGSGRVSVREALRMLEQSGLIYIKQGSDGGAFVREVDVSTATESLYDVMLRAHVTVQDVIEARVRIEDAIIDVAVEKIDDNDFELLKRSIEDAEAIIKEGPQMDSPAFYNRLSETYVDFHRTLAKATKNPVFDVIVECLMNLTRVVFDSELVPPGRFQNHIGHHKAILQALKARDLARVHKVMEAHEGKLRVHFTHLFGKEHPIDQGFPKLQTRQEQKKKEANQ